MARDNDATVPASFQIFCADKLRGPHFRGCTTRDGLKLPTSPPAGPTQRATSSSAVLFDGEVAAADPKLECASANRARRMVVLMSRCTAHRWWCGRPPISSNGFSAHQYGQSGISQSMLQILDLMSCDSLDRNLSASVKGSTPPSGDGGASSNCRASPRTALEILAMTRSCA